MINRYSNRTINKNILDQYKKTFQDRNISFINHYTSPNFIFPTVNEYKKISTAKHIWKIGDRFYKLADQYYGDPADWWIIAKFNNKPTESHLKIGDVIYIPTTIHEVLNYMKG